MPPPADEAGTGLRPFNVAPSELLEVSAGIATIPADEFYPFEERVPLVMIAFADSEGGTQSRGFLLDDGARLFHQLGQALYSLHKRGYRPSVSF